MVGIIVSYHQYAAQLQSFCAYWDIDGLFHFQDDRDWAENMLHKWASLGLHTHDMFEPGTQEETRFTEHLSFSHQPTRRFRKNDKQTTDFPKKIKCPKKHEMKRKVTEWR